MATATIKKPRHQRHKRLPKGERGGIELLLIQNVEHLGKQGEVVEVRPSSMFAFLSCGRSAVPLVLVCAASRGLVYVLSWRCEPYCRNEFLTFRRALRSTLPSIADFGLSSLVPFCGG